MNDNPRFSIVTVCLNSEKTISSTLNSIAKQGYSNLEYIIIDGGSTDSTLDIIKKYEPKFEAKNICFKLVSEKDNGIYDAMNKGISMATGKYIGIINSDDWYEENIIKKIADIFINATELDMVFGNANIFLNNRFLNTFRSSKNFKTINKKMTIRHPTVFIKKEIYTKYGVFDTALKVFSDWDFMIRINKRIKWKYVDIVIANARLGGISCKVDRKMYLEQHTVRYLNNPYSFFDFRLYFRLCFLYIFGIKFANRYYLLRLENSIIKAFIICAMG